jgi:hypothetical protein
MYFALCSRWKVAIGEVERALMKEFIYFRTMKMAALRSTIDAEQAGADSMNIVGNAYLVYLSLAGTLAPTNTTFNGATSYVDAGKTILGKFSKPLHTVFGTELMVESGTDE